MSVQLTPILKEPALITDNTIRCLVISDLHLGMEWDLQHSGITIPSQTDKILARITSHIKQTTPDRIILLGDVKHNVPRTSWQEQEELPAFISELASHAPVHITPGNHDSDIEYLLQEQIDEHLCTITSAKGCIVDGIGYFHGHTWPSSELLQTPYIITAHNHPIIQLTDPLGHTTQQPAWIRTRLHRTPFEQHYQHLSLKEWSDPELIITPAFNHLCGGIPFNTAQHQELLGPLFNNSAVELQHAQAYLLDGTHLGSLQVLTQFSQTRTPTPCRRARKKHHRVSKLSYTR